MDWDWLLPVSLLELPLWVFKFLWSGRGYGGNQNQCDSIQWHDQIILFDVLAFYTLRDHIFSLLMSFFSSNISKL